MEGEGFEYTGFYTQDEIREVIRYAADRYITVIPEIEMPGHALAAIAAYPYLACNEQPTSPRIVWGVEDTVLCPGKESTFDFLTDVLTEVADLFPSEYIHIGGDECPKDTWKNCPRCQKRIRSEKLNLNDSIPPEHRLQAYFIARIERIVHNLNKKIIGWDEILEGGLPPDATVMSWRGEQGGIDAALQGHNVIMTPGSEGLYIDRYEGQPLVEPLAIGGRSTLDTIYRYDPVPPRLASKAHHILGVQANLWAEYLYSPDLVEYRAYPRTLALAEIAWTATKRKDFDDFLLRLDNAFPRLDALHINYHIPTPEMPLDLPNFIAFTDTISLSFSTSRNLRIVYSRDGSDPNQFSESYMFPIFFDDSDTLKIRALLLHGALGPIRTIVLKKQKLAPPAHTHHALQQGLALKTTPGYFLATDAIPLDALWNDSILSDLKHLAALHPFDWGRSTRNVPPYAAIANGFLFIPKDGVYFFHSDLEQLWIDNQLLVSNQGLPKKFSPNDASIALTKGFHHFEVVFLSHVIGGWPSFWSSSDVRLRYYKDPTFANISPELLFH
jgi:hexosaminidase